MIVVARSGPSLWWLAAVWQADLYCLCRDVEGEIGGRMQSDLQMRRKLMASDQRQSDQRSGDDQESLGGVPTGRYDQWGKS